MNPENPQQLPAVNSEQSSVNSQPLVPNPSINDLTNQPSPVNFPPPPQPKKNSLMLVAILLVVVALLAVLAYVLGMQYFDKKQILPIAPQACTEEAKICEDGSSVGRSGPNCEFAECPAVSATPDPTADWKTYTNNQLGFEFKSPNLLKPSDISGSVTVSGKIYQTKQFTEEDSQAMSDTVVRAIYNWTRPEVDPYGTSIFSQQTVNGNVWNVAYTENIPHDPGCFSASAQTLTSDKKNTIEITVYETCPSDLTLKKSLNELNQILSTFKFLDSTPSASQQ
ncbi:MAG TPA: hypothetical protein VL401_03105 [Alphaproteobacteria bacterium]|jgi:hypothetical protein|nr:hypothetical protein [Alphaproteobacteria bacterium]